VNHLAGEKSPYLLQHASNPVDWHPWGEEALRRARKEDKPIFLSIGYSTCHWCHVMEKESFEDPAVAALMNETFVSIKVDREERPDLDDSYMKASQLMTGSGGWPLTIVMTPDGNPFFAATYIPKEKAYGRSCMLELVPRIAALWKDRRADILSSADSIGEELLKAAGAGVSGIGSASAAAPEAAVVGQASAGLARMFDATNGGFGAAPKFPMPTVFTLLLRSWKRNGDAQALRMTEESLTAMRNGGVYDQLGFGFHRYSTDAEWHVPHFEKMLYDQALLALAYTEAWQATGGDFYRRTAREILTYVLRDMTSPAGAFYSAEDADSEGEEGRFYLWSADEIRAVLPGAESAAFLDMYRIEGSGANILRRDAAQTAAAGAVEERLLAARQKRVRPFRDDKVLADWNGLMIAALARAGGAFDDPSFTKAAGRAAEFALGRMRTRDGRLLHRFRDGEAAIRGFADDYAFLAWGLLELYAASFNPRWLQEAIRLVDVFVADHWDPSAGGFFQTAVDAGQKGGAAAQDRRGRQKPLIDGVVPSANSVALLVLSKLGEITGDTCHRSRAEAIARLYPADLGSGGIRYSFLLSALDFALGPSFEIVVAGDPEKADTRAMLSALRRSFLPKATVVFRPVYVEEPLMANIVKIAPYTSAQGALNGKATAYVCLNYACRLPTNDIAVMLQELGVR